MSFWEELISILWSEAVLTFEKLISRNCKTSKNNASKENHLNCYVKIPPADWHICKHYTCGFFFLFFFWGWMEEFSCCSAPEAKLEIAKELCPVIRIAYWLLEYNSLHPFFFSTWSFLPSAFFGIGATWCLEAISYISFGLFPSFPPMYQGSQAHNALGHLTDTSLFLLLFFWHKIGLSFIV